MEKKYLFNPFPWPKLHHLNFFATRVRASHACLAVQCMLTRMRHTRAQFVPESQGQPPRPPPHPQRLVQRPVLPARMTYHREQAPAVGAWLFWSPRRHPRSRRPPPPPLQSPQLREPAAASRTLFRRNNMTRTELSAQHNNALPTTLTYSKPLPSGSPSQKGVASLERADVASAGLRARTRPPGCSAALARS